MKYIIILIIVLHCSNAFGASKQGNYQQLKEVGQLIQKQFKEIINNYKNSRVSKEEYLKYLKDFRKILEKKNKKVKARREFKKNYPKLAKFRKDMNWCINEVKRLFWRKYIFINGEEYRDVNGELAKVKIFKRIDPQFKE